MKLKKLFYYLGTFLIILGCLGFYIIGQFFVFLALLGMFLVLFSNQKLWIKLITIISVPIGTILGLLIFISVFSEP
jgi:hypothetical protein